MYIYPGVHVSDVYRIDLLSELQLMSSVKAVLIEMLSTFDAKSRLGAKQLKDQLHTCWPVPNSRVALDQLRKELRDEMKQSLEVVSPYGFKSIHNHNCDI